MPPHLTPLIPTNPRRRATMRHYMTIAGACVFYAMLGLAMLGFWVATP